MTANLARLFAAVLALLLVATPATWAADQTITLRLGTGSPLGLKPGVMVGVSLATD